MPPRVSAEQYYRPDIEGLRAVAILLVVAVHAGLPGFGGGFIGVDIFFVISGFLVTGLLIRERATSSRIDLAGFYARRLRRLLPAMLLMLLVTALAAWLILPSFAQRDQAITAVTAALWVSNLHFAFGNLDYFGPAADTNLYLHTWSLGVEEQFYLIWPVLVALLVGRQGQQRKRRLVLGMATIAVVGMVACLWVSSFSSRLAFYLMPTRAWQFAVGALAFLLVDQPKSFLSAAWSPKLQAIAGWLGVFLLGMALWLVDAGSPWPSYWAMLPTLGAALVIVAGCGNGGSPVTRLFAFPPMQAIGRISYSWYLWHWPVLVLGAVVLPIQEPTSRLFLVLLSLGLAAVSYFVVEQPLRGKIIQKPPRFIIASLFGTTLVVLLMTQWTSLAKGDTGGEANDWAGEIPVIYQMGCDQWYHNSVLTPCVFGKGSKAVVVIGDSIGLQWFPAYQQIFAESDWTIVVLTKSSCPMVDRPIYYARIGREFTECAEWRQQALEMIARNQPELVIMGSSHSAAYKADEWSEGTRSVISQISPHVGEVVVMSSTPKLPFNGAVCAASSSRLKQWLSDGKACVAPLTDIRRDQVTRWIREGAKGWDNVRIVDMTDRICPDATCSAVVDGRLAFRDNQHLHAEFVTMLAKPLAQRLGIALSNTGSQ